MSEFDDRTKSGLGLDNDSKLVISKDRKDAHVPLDDAKLERAVNTTEKLVRRMDALEARRKDFPKYAAGTGGRGPPSTFANSSRKAKEISSRFPEDIQLEIDKIAKEAESRKDPKGAWPKDLMRKWDKLSLEKREVIQAGKNRKDDYGHPVKSNNRVQQTDYGQEADNKKSVDARRGQEDN